MSIKILLADDHNLVRQGLRALLEKQADIEVVAEATDGQSALNLAKETISRYNCHGRVNAWFERYRGDSEDYQ